MGRSRRERYLDGDRENDSGSDSSKSRSRSARSGSSGSNKSRSGSPKSRSGSPKSRSGSARSRSGSGSRSGKSKSPSRSRSGSGSPARSKSGSRSKSRSKSPSKSKSPKNNSDSESESNKKRQLSGDNGDNVDSDSNKKVKDGSASPTEEVGAEDLFGDDLSVSSEDESDKAAKKKVIDSDGDDVARYDDDDGSNKRRAVIGSDSEDEKDKEEGKEKEVKRYEDKPEEEPVPETRIDVEVPKINTDLGKEIHFVKLPNFLSMESRPFDPETYEDEMDDDQSQQDEEGRTRLKLKVENTIRWRQKLDKDLNPIRESNARIVKWSDGSYSLHLGNEIFDVYKQPLQSDFNHLFIRQGTGLQGQAVFKTKLSFRPHSVDSHTHKKMTLSMADRSTKSNQIKVISHVGNNPEEGRWEKIRKEEQGLRMAMKSVSSKNRVSWLLNTNQCLFKLNSGRAGFLKVRLHITFLLI